MRTPLEMKSKRKTTHGHAQWGKPGAKEQEEDEKGAGDESVCSA